MPGDISRGRRTFGTTVADPRGHAVGRERDPHQDPRGYGHRQPGSVNDDRAESLECTHGEDILIAESATDLAASLVGLLRDREQVFRLGLAGRRVVEGKCSWDVRADMMRSQIARVLEREYESTTSSAK